MTITGIPPTHLVPSLTSKLSSKKQEGRLSASSHVRTPDSLGAKLLTASTALRAYRNRHLGTLMRCCEAWEPVGKCFDPNFFECIDFHGLSQIVASLTRENLTEREAEIRNLYWAKCRLGLRAWRAKKPMLCLHAVTDEDVHPLVNEDESGRRICEYWSTIFQARVECQRHHHYEDILQYVQKAPDDIRWEIDKNEFDELMAAKKESAPGPDGIPYSLYRCAGGLGSQVLFNAYNHAGRRHYPCAICRKQNCAYSQVLRR